MLHRRLRHACTIIPLALAAAPVGAQYRVRLLQPPARSWPATGSVPQAAERRSPVAAGLLSLALPFGTGSFYAGHRRHGVTHLVVGVLSFSTMFLGSVECIFTNIEGDGNRGICRVTDVAATTFAVNWVWGVASAVNDANAFNRRAGAPAP